MSKPRVFRWTLQLNVSEIWVADGFNPTNDQLTEAIRQSMLGYANSDEVSVAILAKPNQNDVALAQGYPSLAEMERQNRK